MHTPDDTKLPSVAPPLTNVLHETRQVQHLLHECGEALAEVNAELKLDVNEPQASTGRQIALEKNQAVEETVAVVTDKVQAVEGALNGQLRERQLIEHQFAAAIEQEAAARHLALHDALTGLANRALLMDRLEHELAQAERHAWSVAVMFIDLDDFKLVNDQMGHAAGDRLLQIVGQRLVAKTRSVDTVCRFGGDEFVLLLTDVNEPADVAKLAQSLLDSLRAPVLLAEHAQTESPGIGASIGIALFPLHAQTAAELLSMADTAMYQAKRSGSGYAFASESKLGLTTS